MRRQHRRAHPRLGDGARARARAPHRLLRLTIPDQPGVLGQIATRLGRLGANILEVEHRRLFLDVPAKGAKLDVTVETRIGRTGRRSSRRSPRRATSRCGSTRRPRRSDRRRSCARRSFALRWSASAASRSPSTCTASARKSSSWYAPPARTPLRIVPSGRARPSSSAWTGAPGIRH